MWRPRSWALLCLVVVAAAAMAAGAPDPRDGLTVTAIDVGQGDAILIESGRARVLIDAGGDGRAASWLARTGRRRIDLVIVTHGHQDHVGGVDEVLDRLRVRALWVRPVAGETGEAIDAVIRLATARGIPVQVPVAGRAVTIGDLRLEVLHPPGADSFARAPNEVNEASIVVRASSAGRRVLVGGDIERGTQALLLAGEPALLRAEVLVVPHHGSRTNDPAFLAATGASIALVSVGAGNTYGHPHRETLAALEAAGIEVRRTDREGTVRVRVPAPRVPTAITTLAPVRVAREAIGGKPRADRGRRRPPARPRARTAPRGTHRRGPGAPSVAPRRDRPHSPARAAHGLALRRTQLCGRAGDRAAER